MLLLLLLLEKPRDHYVEFFFTKLRKKEDKEFFLNNFNDEFIVDRLNNLTDLFLRYPFYAPEIKEFVRKEINGILRFDQSFKKITEYQLQFYLDIYSEFGILKDYGSYTEIKGNRSFQYISTEDETALELFFLDLYYETHKAKMTDEEVKEFMLKRLMKATFPDKKEK